MFKFKVWSLFNFHPFLRQTFKSAVAGNSLCKFVWNKLTDECKSIYMMDPAKDDISCHSFNWNKRHAWLETLSIHNVDSMVTLLSHYYSITNKLFSSLIYIIFALSTLTFDFHNTIFFWNKYFIFSVIFPRKVVSRFC